MRTHPSASRALDRSAVIIGALLLLALLSVPALLAPWLPLEDPQAGLLTDRLLPAFSPGHPSGTDHLGCDLLSRLVWGARTSLIAGVSATLLAAFVGGCLGLAAGFPGRLFDSLLMRGIDILTAFPPLLLAVAIIAALGPGLPHLVIAVAIANVPAFARSWRDAVVDLKAKPFVDAARLAGLGPGSILLRELLPNLLPLASVMLATTLGWVVLEIAGLSFLGLGVQAPTVDLGRLLREGAELLTLDSRLTLLPGLLLVLIVVGFNLLGNGMRNLMDADGPDVLAVAAEHESIGSEADDELDESDEVLLRVRGLQVGFPGDGNGDEVKAVAGIDLALDAGERVALVGEIGSGKTMTALSLLRLVPPPGRIRADIGFAGRDILTLADTAVDVLRGGSIAYIPSDLSATLDPLFTIGEQLTETLLAHQDLPKREVRWQVHQLLEQVRFPDPAVMAGRYPHQLSSGMRQRAAIAMALANGPDLLIADEPTRTLDLTIQEDILVLLDRLCRENDRALLFISQDPCVAARLCRRILVMYAGRIVEDAPVLDLVRQPLHPYSRELLAGLPEPGQADKALSGPRDELPDAVGIDIGCAFAPRCRHVVDACMEQEPALIECGDGRWARCFRVAEII